MWFDWISGNGPQTLFYALVLASARMLAFVIAHPVFTKMGVQAGVVRGAIVFVMSAPVFLAVSSQLSGQDLPSNFEMVGLIGKEILIGLLLAIILGVPFWAASAAGDMIDLQRGASMATLVDPGSGDETTPTGTLFFLFALLLLSTSDWFRDILLGNIYSSYTIWPVMRPLPELSLDATALVLELLANILLIGLVLALPIFASLLLTELSLAVAGRYLPQMNIMLLALSGKQIIYVILLPIYFVSLLYFQQRLFATLDLSIEQLGEIISGAPEEPASQ